MVAVKRLVVVGVVVVVSCWLVSDAVGDLLKRDGCGGGGVSGCGCVVVLDDGWMIWVNI